MASINTVAMVGHLTRDAELKYTNSGTAIVKFSLALNRRKKVGDSWQDEAHFFDVTMMGKAAEGVHKFLSKGKQVAISGELRQERWESDGQPRSKVSIFAFSLQLLGSAQGETRRNPDPDMGGAESDFEDDIPF
jgi:single-strand DNA-binding protein